MTRVFRIVGILIILTALVPLGVGYYFYRSSTQFVRSAVEVEAVVSEIEERSSEGSISYYPVFSFVDREGEVHRITAGWGSNPPSHEIGDTVTLLYDPAEPHEARRDGFVSLWLAPTIAGALALIPLMVGVIVAFVAPLAVGQIDHGRPRQPGAGGEAEGPAATERPAESTGTHPGPTREEKNWALFAHLASLAFFLGIPFGNILGPLVIWLARKDQSAFVAEHGRESLNFQLSVTLYGLVSAILCLVLIGFVLLIALAVVAFVLVVMAALRADRGEPYRYPFTIRFVGPR